MVTRYENWITTDPSICGGQPVIRGTRDPLRTVLGSLAEGDSIEQIVTFSPTLTPEAVRAVIFFSTATASGDVPIPGGLAFGVSIERAKGPSVADAS